MKPLVTSIALLLVIFTSPVANAAPNELTRQFCLGIKTMARQVKEARDSGMTQADYTRIAADITKKFEGSRNLDLVVRINSAVIRAAWLTDADPQTYSEFAHETCLETVVLVP